MSVALKLPERRCRLQALGIHKRYDGTVALAGVDFTVEPGTIHVLVGENGAGKSTLMKILAGVEPPTSGRLILDDVEIRLGSTRAAADHGVGIIHQELNLCPNLSVLENIFLGRERTRRRLLDVSREEGLACEVLARLGHPIDLETRVGDLPLGQQQIVEIAKALVDDVRILIMDEPTSALSASEVVGLFRIIRDLADRGVGVVYISHRLEELLAIGDQITVLRDGRVVAAARVADVDARWIVEQMIGREVVSPPVSARAAGAEVLRVEGLSVVENGRVRLDSVSFEAHQGEILGIYGLMGAGRTELLEALAGARKLAAGRIQLGGVPVEGHPIIRRIAQGMVLVPEDRQGAGIVPTTSVAHNLGLSSVHLRARHGVIDDRAEVDALGAEGTRLGVKAPSLDASITALSGGNQQKVVIGRALLTRPRVLLLDEPSRGIDVAAKAEIFRLMSELSRAGLVIVFASSELNEILALSDRILVLSRGRMTGLFTRENASAASLLAASGRGGDR